MEIVIVGAGGQARIVADILRAAGRDRIAGLVDDDPATHERELLGIPVRGTTADLPSIAHDAVIVAIGDNAIRRDVTDRLRAAGERIASAIHPFTSIAADVEIGEGAMISAGAIVTASARIGRGVLLNTKASIDHQCAIGDFVHVAPGATIGGDVTLGDEVLIAAAAVVASGCRVGARTIVGAGAVVVRDLPSDVVAYGAPARVIRVR